MNHNCMALIKFVLVKYGIALYNINVFNIIFLISRTSGKLIGPHNT